MNQLQSEIQQLESNPTKNQEELDSKKQQLKDLETKSKELTKSLPLDTQISILEKEIKKQSNSNTNNANPSDKTILYLGLGIIGVVLIGLAFILLRKKRKH